MCDHGTDVDIDVIVDLALDGDGDGSAAQPCQHSADRGQQLASLCMKRSTSYASCGTSPFVAVAVAVKVNDQVNVNDPHVAATGGPSTM